MEISMMKLEDICSKDDNLKYIIDFRDQDDSPLGVIYSIVFDRLKVSSDLNRINLISNNSFLRFNNIQNLFIEKDSVVGTVLLVVYSEKKKRCRIFIK